MINIGIIGSDNSHAIAFAKLLNFPDKKTGKYAFPNVRAKYIFGLVPAETDKVLEEGGDITAVPDPAEMLGQVDAVMIVFRHGDLHARYALPFIKAGIPVWMDKPFAISNVDARSMLEAAIDAGSLLTGGSTCKYTKDLLAVKSVFESGARIGKLKTAVLNFPAEMENEYGGLYFYGAHLVEMALYAFGPEALSVVATATNGLVTAILKYAEFQITLQFIPAGRENYAVLYGERGTSFREIDITRSYNDGMREFVRMLETKEWPLTPEFLFASTAVLNAIIESYKTGKEISIAKY
jgi:predicted dehydrogenase